MFVLHRVRSVSYTHLDVYKRQEKNGLIQEQKRAENREKLQDANKKMEGLLADIEHKRQQKEALLTQLQEIAVPAEMIQAARCV